MTRYCVQWEGGRFVVRAESLAHPLQSLTTFERAVRIARYLNARELRQPCAA